MIQAFIVYGPRNREFYVHVGDDGGIVATSEEIEQFVKRDWLPVKKKMEEKFGWKVEAVARVSAAPKPCPVPRPWVGPRGEIKGVRYPAPDVRVRGLWESIPFARRPADVESEEQPWSFPSKTVTIGADLGAISMTPAPELTKLVEMIEHLQRMVYEATCVPRPMMVPASALLAGGVIKRDVSA